MYYKLSEESVKGIEDLLSSVNLAKKYGVVDYKAAYYALINLLNKSLEKVETPTPKPKPKPKKVVK